MSDALSRPEHLLHKVGGRGGNSAACASGGGLSLISAGKPARCNDSTQEVSDLHVK